MEADGGASNGYQEVIDDALTTTGARVVVLTGLDSDGTVHAVAWGGLQSALLQRALELVRLVLPGFDPIGLSTRADVNPSIRRSFVEGEPVVCTLAELAEGAVHPYVAEVGGRVVGIEHCYQHPLRTSERIEGALTFLNQDAPTEARLSACAAFSRQVALTLENARLLQQARRARAELEAVFDATSDAVIVFGPGGEVLRANGMARRLMSGAGGLLRRLEQGWAHVRFSGDEAALPALDAIERALHGTLASGVVELPVPGLGPRRFHVQAAPIHEGRGAIAVARDITDLHRAIVERARFDGAIKTARLVAHELNNKLSYTVGYGSLLLKSLALESEAARLARLTVDGADEAAAIVHQLQRLIRFQETEERHGEPMLDLDASTGTGGDPVE